MSDIKDNCSTCKHLIKSGDQLSPGGRITVFNYRCMNKNSEVYLCEMNYVIDSLGNRTLDSRKYNTCDKHEKNEK